jgi:hypothetical protein
MTSREVPKFCTVGSRKPQLLDGAADLLQVGRLRVGHLHDRAAGELDGQVQAARGEEEHGGQRT